MKKQHAMTRLSGALAAAALACGMVLAATPAHADSGESASDSRALVLEWHDDGPANATETFFGAPVAVPGDHAERSITVTNAGPGDAVLRAEITGVKLLSPGAADVHNNPAHVTPAGDHYGGAGDQGDFYDDVLIGWGAESASLTALHDQGSTQVLEVAVKRGEQQTLTLSYDFDVAATSGNTANVADRSASFDVVLTLEGDTEGVTPVDPEPKPGPKPEPKPGPGAERPPLAMTGGTFEPWIIAGAGSLVLIGAAIALLRRRLT